GQVDWHPGQVTVTAMWRLSQMKTLSPAWTAGLCSFPFQRQVHVRRPDERGHQVFLVRQVAVRVEFLGRRGNLAEQVYPVSGPGLGDEYHEIDLELHVGLGTCEGDQAGLQVYERGAAGVAVHAPRPRRPARLAPGLRPGERRGRRRPALFPADDRAVVFDD